MATNFYFQSGIPEEFTNNQRLVESLIIQAIQITGMDIYYLPRTLVNVDTILTEDNLSKFESAIPIEVYLENVNGFDGDGSLLSKFGIEIADSCTFVMVRSRWNEQVGQSGRARSTIRPLEGDIIYMPMTKSLFEIKKVVADNPFYQLGKLFVYKLECELFQYASERFETGIEEVDLFSDLNSLDIDTLGTSSQAGAQNDDFDAADDILDFTEHNPFAEINH